MNHTQFIKLTTGIMKRENLNRLAEQSFTKGRMDNNIVDLTQKDVLEILNEIY